MLNRTDILKRLIQIRRVIYRKEEMLDSPPVLEDIKIKKELDNLIKDVIGDFLNENDKESLDKILLKTICEEISVEMAMVAINEIIQEYYPENKDNTAKNKTDRQGNKDYEEAQLAAAYYQKGYR